LMIRKANVCCVHFPQMVNKYLLNGDMALSNSKLACWMKTFWGRQCVGDQCDWVHTITISNWG
jgi:hypothetical protein